MGLLQLLLVPDKCIMRQKPHNFNKLFKFREVQVTCRCICSKTEGRVRMETETALHGNDIFHPSRAVAIAFDHAGCFWFKVCFFSLVCVGGGEMKFIENDAFNLFPLRWPRLRTWNVFAGGGGCRDLQLDRDLYWSRIDFWLSNGIMHNRRTPICQDKCRLDSTARRGSGWLSIIAPNWAGHIWTLSVEGKICSDRI